jgi:hypothetical protein
VALALLPGGPQRVRQQRKSPGLVPHLTFTGGDGGFPEIMQQQLDKALIDGQPHILCWEEDRLP